MLLEILVTVPSLILAEIAWCVRFAVALTCMTILFAVAIAAVGLYCRRAEPRHFSQPCRATYRAAYHANSGFCQLGATDQFCGPDYQVGCLTKPLCARHC